MSTTKSIIGKLILMLSALIFSLSANAQQHLSIALRDASVAQLAQAVQQQTDCTFVYAEEAVAGVKITVSAQDVSLSELLTQALRGTGLTFRITQRHVVIGRVRANRIDDAPQRSTRTISGHIIDAVSRETLIGATAFCTETRQGAASNEYGFFSLTLPAGPATMRFSYIGYETQAVALADGGDASLTIMLQSDNQIAEVEVKADRPETGNASTRTGAVSVPVAYISQLPSLMSEPDVMRALHTMPGVQKGISGTSGIFVRGGGQEQNLFLLDGVSLYNVDHLFGFMSAFMPDAVKNVDFYKSAFPARYGGRLSSVVDVRTKDGDMQNYHGAMSLGLLSSHATLEGPIVSDRTSFIVSARRSYVDGIFALVSKIVDDNDISALRPSFYDVNVKLNHILSDSDRLFASFYIGKDSYRFNLHNDSQFYTTDENATLVEDTTRSSRSSTNMKARWGNTLASIRWNHVFSPRLFSNTTLAFNEFNFRLTQSMSEKNWEYNVLTRADEYESRYESGISDLTLIHDLDFHPQPAHHVRMGGLYVLHSFLPQVTNGVTSSIADADSALVISDFRVAGETTKGHESALYAEDDMSLSDRLQMIVGLRASIFGVDGKAYPALEPRLSACFQPADLWRVKASYAMMHQYVHLLATMPVSLPTDLWVPVTKNVKPMSSNQLSLGLYSDAIPSFTISLESYFKLMNNILDFKDGAKFSGNSTTGWERLVESGRGRSYGLEFSAQRTTGRVTGQLSYTLARSELKFGKNINAGRWYPFKYDRRHTLSIVGQCKCSDRFDFGAQWSFATGSCMSVPDKLVHLSLPASNNGNYYGSDDMAICSARNNYRLAPIHSLDLSANFHKQLRHVSRTLSISIMNAYAHHNQDVVYAWREGHAAHADGTLRKPGEEPLDTDVYSGRTMLSQTTIIPFLPSVSYSVKF